ncbi:MAG: hypothetical protein ABI912_01875 [Actinomycetota bacterium]
MIVLEVALILGSLAVGSSLVLRRRSAGRSSHPQSMDAPATLLTWAVGFLAADREQWGQAMLGELEHLEQRPTRWRFALGCLAATLLVPPGQGDARRLVGALVSAASLASAGLVSFALLRYPGIVTGLGTWLALTTFAAVLLGFTLFALLLVRRGAAAGLGLACGVAVAVVWIVVGVTVVNSAKARPVFSLLLLALPLAALVAGGAGTWHGRTGAAGRKTALLTGLVAGLVLFLVVAASTLLTAGGPYDAGLVRDFPTSGLPDLATYAVSDNLGTAMALLLFASTVTAVLGCAAASVIARLRRDRTAA